jgi:hypothetical protein
MQIWQPTDSMKLRQLRLEQGLDVFVVAQKCSISLRQMQELEGEGEGAFYSAAIKYQVGLKVLRALGDSIESVPQGQESRLGLSNQHKPKAMSLQVVPPAENRNLLYSIGLALVAVGSFMSMVNLINGIGLRPGVTLIFLIGLAMVIACYFSQTDWAVRLMSWGILGATLAAAYSVRGLEHVGWIALPMAIMSVGWFIGKASTWTFTALSILCVMGFYALHKQNHPFDDVIPLGTVAAAIIGSCVISSFIANSLCETFGKQYKLVQESRAELLAVMDSSRALIWSVSANDFRLRIFNRIFAQEIFAKFGVTPRIGDLPNEIFSESGSGQRWLDHYAKVLEEGGAAWEEEPFHDGRLFEVSCQKIIEGTRVVGLAVYAKLIS